MNKDELIDVSKRMVKEYHNRYIDTKNLIDVDDIEVVGYHDNATSRWLLLSVPTFNNIKYEFSYSKKTKQLHTYKHDKDEEKTFKKKMNIFKEGEWV